MKTKNKRIKKSSVLGPGIGPFVVFANGANDGGLKRGER